MRTFDHFPDHVDCIICRTRRDAECWLMPVDGTTDGRICEAVPVHVECTGRVLIDRLQYNREHGIVYCRTGEHR